MAEQFTVDRLEASYPKAGFSTQVGAVTPFYGRDASYVVVGGVKWLTPAEAKRAAAALLTVADLLERRAVDIPGQA